MTRIDLTVAGSTNLRDTSWRQNWKAYLAVGAVVIVLLAPIRPVWGGAQQASRYLLTAAIWDQHTVVLDDYRHLLGSDHATRNAVIYSDKAPGEPFLVAPFYGLYRLVGGERPDTADTNPDIGLWWLTIWSSVIPGAVLASLMYRWAREINPSSALIATLSISLGTLLLAFSRLLFGHVMAAVFVFGMFLLVRRRNVSTLVMVWTGVLGGLAVAVEYPVLLIVLVLMVAAAIRHRWTAMWMVLGGLPLALFVGVYNRLVTGSAFTAPIQWTGFSGAREAARRPWDFFHIADFFGAPARNFVEVLLSPRGLLVATPVVLLALIGIPLLWSRSRFEAVVVTLTFVSMFLVQAFWSNPFAGGAGPRYVTPAMPFLAAPLALVWARFKSLSRFLVAVSILTMVAAVFTQPQLASSDVAGLGFWIRKAIAGDVVSTWWTQLVGKGGWLLHVLSVVTVILVATRFDVSTRRLSPSEG